MAHVNEVAVSSDAGEDNQAGSRGPGDGCRAGVIFATLGVSVASSVVAELGQNPGAKDCSKSWETANDLGVRVRLKRCRQLGLQL